MAAAIRRTVVRASSFIVIGFRRGKQVGVTTLGSARPKKEPHAPSVATGHTPSLSDRRGIPTPLIRVDESRFLLRFSRLQCGEPQTAYDRHDRVSRRGWCTP